MFGAGSPSAEQVKLIGGPSSSTTCSWNYGSDRQVRCTDLRANTVLWEFYSFADPPERVQLQVIEDTVCKGANVIFNCSAADANPVAIIYHLYENNVMISNSTSTGILNRTMTIRGVFGYSCKVTNIVGTTMSPNVSVTVNGKHAWYFFNQQKRIRKQVSFLGKQTLFAVQSKCPLVHQYVINDDNLSQVNKHK